MKNFKISRVILSLFIGISFLLPLIGLIGLALGYNDGGYDGSGGGP